VVSLVSGHNIWQYLFVINCGNCGDYFFVIMNGFRGHWSFKVLVVLLSLSLVLNGKLRGLYTDSGLARNPKKPREVPS